MSKWVKWPLFTWLIRARRAIQIVFGDNILTAAVDAKGGEGDGDIVIDELEVTIVPPWTWPE